MLAQLRADVIDGWPPWWRGSPRLKNPLVALLKMPIPPPPTLSSRSYDIFLLFCHISGGYQPLSAGSLNLLKVEHGLDGFGGEVVKAWFASTEI
jgi:hypothetical protein